MESRITSKGGSIADINAAMDGCDASNVSYSVVSNGMEATQEKAPYLGRTRSIGSCSQRDLASFMRTLGCETHEMEIMRIWDVSGAHVIKSLKEQPRMFDLGFVRIGPQLGGGFPSADAEFDPERNRLYVGVQPSDGIRTALSEGTPTRLGEVSPMPEIGNVQYMNHRDTAKAGEPFDIIGRYLTVAVGDEHAEFRLPGDGGTVPVQLEVQTSETDGRQRLKGRIPASVAACTGATLVVWTHGQDAAASLKLVKRGNITILEGETPPEPVGEPTVTNAKSTGYADRTVNIGGGDLTVEGENLATATEVKFLDPDGSEFYTVPVTYADGKLVAADGTVRTEGPASGSVKVTTAGGTATLDVTFTTP